MIMVAMSYFCRQNMSQISLEIVVNCSHPSEILALAPYFAKKSLMFTLTFPRCLKTEMLEMMLEMKTILQLCKHNVLYFAHFVRKKLPSRASITCFWT